MLCQKPKLYKQHFLTTGSLLLCLLCCSQSRAERHQARYADHWITMRHCLHCLLPHALPHTQLPAPMKQDDHTQ